MAPPVFFNLVVPRLLAASVLAVVGFAWTHPAKARAAWGLARKCLCGVSCLLPTREELGSVSAGNGAPCWGADPLGVVARGLLQDVQADEPTLN
jgi:hypothetical protein